MTNCCTDFYTHNEEKKKNSQFIFSESRYIPQRKLWERERADEYPFKVWTYDDIIESPAPNFPANKLAFQAAPE